MKTLTALAVFLLALASGTSASSMNVMANISFERAIDVRKESDVNFGGLRASPLTKSRWTLVAR